MNATVILQVYKPSIIWPFEVVVEIVCSEWDDLFALECGDVVIEFFTIQIGEFL